MTGLALGVLAVGVGLVLLGGVMLTEARRIRRDADRNVERIFGTANGQTNALVDRLMHATGQTWTLPPAMLAETRQPEEAEAPVVSPAVESFLSPADYSGELAFSSNGGEAL